ncbi:hypothetical protein Caci_7215 [Catenulispora acidiphila DSM 44928]|uniref:Uncharacterized protein n=1 Tax=Catenulispora acidiphila (strain DSM 44928 / JCM 14897 / NBRC 102108 / NRRL B-24433 / ID139908) TaxID=479433 RepID=C7Q731_CATAD|nr:hypothetical protein [Catenulispora acidiphila]ACU76044.1 hypothetical protein Caci_7215 [Catenulispora acidiphila DSM 44928]
MTDEGNESQGPDTGSRRLCAALASDRPGLLAEACAGGGFARLFLAVLDDGTQAAIAPAGVDEVRLVRDLVEAVTARLPESDGPDSGSPPTLLALNVGIMRVLDDGFAGAGLDRARALANDAAVTAAVSAAVTSAVADHDGADGRKRHGFAVVLSEGLYTDLRDEGYAIEDWHPVRPPGARFRCFGAGTDHEDR